MCRWLHSLGYRGPCTEHRLSAVSWYCIPTCQNTHIYTVIYPTKTNEQTLVWTWHKQCKFHTTAQQKCMKWQNRDIIQNILRIQIWQNSFAHTLYTVEKTVNRKHFASSRHSHIESFPFIAVSASKGHSQYLTLVYTMRTTYATHAMQGFTERMQCMQHITWQIPAMSLATSCSASIKL